MKAGSIPQMKIAFSLTLAANFFNGGGQSCYITPSFPDVTVTFLN